MDPAAVAERLSGTWEGSGEGVFPTIEPFTYRDRIIVTPTAEAGLLHYEQQTWRHTAGGEVGSHVETGFIHLGADGAIQVLNAQGFDRVEVLRGTVTAADAALEIALHSVTLAHDDRMMSSWRMMRIEDDALGYEMGMATTAVPAGALHLTARLVRR